MRESKGRLNVKITFTTRIFISFVFFFISTDEESSCQRSELDILNFVLR